MPPSVRLIAPGWYGIANVKWLQRIEVLPTRYENRFMARDYVTIREQQIDGQAVWTETSVGPASLKSAPAKVTRAGSQYRIVGAAWGAAWLWHSRIPADDERSDKRSRAQNAGRAPCCCRGRRTLSR